MPTDPVFSQKQVVRSYKGMMHRIGIVALCLSSTAAFLVTPALRIESSVARNAQNAASVAANIKMQENSEASSISRRSALVALAGLAAGTVPGWKAAQAAEPVEVDMYIGAGCFWHVQVKKKTGAQNKKDHQFVCIQVSVIVLGFSIFMHDT
jgi:hypothetical protein